MNGVIHIRRIQALLDLERAVYRFAEDAQPLVLQIRACLTRRLETVEHNIQSQCRKVEYLESCVIDARLSVRLCRSQMDEEDEYPPDCNRECEVLSEAQAALSKAQADLHRLRWWQRTLRNEGAQVESCLLRLDGLSTEWAIGTRSFLSNAYRHLQEYVRIKPDAALSDLLSQVEGLMGRPPSINATAQGPEREIRAELPGTGEPQGERGITFVEVADLPMPDGISGPEDFEKVPMSEMRDGLGRLQEMSIRLQNGQADGAYWRQLDKETGRQYADGYERIFDAFYGDGRIRVEYMEGRYRIINGRHRIWLAKALGLRHLPVDLVLVNRQPDE